VSGRFGVSFSDVLYESRLPSGLPARLLFLFEHKSYIPSHPVQLQLLDYYLQIWEDDLRNERPLSFIVPIVVYHGPKGWKQRSFSEYFPGLPAGWQRFIPNFLYLLTDLSSLSVKEIDGKRGGLHLNKLFLALKLARDKHMMFDNWGKILTFGGELVEKDRVAILLQTLILYVYNLHDMTDAQVKELNKQLPDSEQDLFNAIPEIFGRKWREEGMEAGVAKGWKEGMENASQSFTINMIKKFPNWSDKEIAELVGVAEDFVKTMRKRV
jgi:hypothetical protein